MTAEQLKRATIALHRYYIWANKMRDHFIEKVPLVMKLPDPKDRFAPECIEADMYMSFWYSALYVVIEGWVRLELTDPTIDVLLASPNVGFLKQYRHGVSHFQANYFDEKFLGLMRRQGSANWLRELNNAFGTYFLNRDRT